ncbi:hypothetical protein K466DRAFT_588062 [Polyporus arcularius HHB13444]|uniref:Uncharacterized protein n=1 Tax=Polyporus arcularius HHB13444 TaxID=1314778 RepID=A0A5C3PB88_9APHY|nr:hypothetical protein K466DRAFT_588062 [Polyporus arcularius HHB13444]
MNAVWTPYIEDQELKDTTRRNGPAWRKTSTAVAIRIASSLFAAPRCLPILQHPRTLRDRTP